MENPIKLNPQVVQGYEQITKVQHGQNLTKQTLNENKCLNVMPYVHGFEINLLFLVTIRNFSPFPRPHNYLSLADALTETYTVGPTVYTYIYNVTIWLIIVHT